MEPIYIIGAGAIGKVLAVCLSNNGKTAVLLRGSVDNGESATSIFPPYVEELCFLLLSPITSARK